MTNGETILFYCLNCILLTLGLGMCVLPQVVILRMTRCRWQTIIPNPDSVAIKYFNLSYSLANYSDGTADCHGTDACTSITAIQYGCRQVKRQ